MDGEFTTALVNTWYVIQQEQTLLDGLLEEETVSLGEGDGCLVDRCECVEILKVNYYSFGVQENDDCSREEEDEYSHSVLTRCPYVNYDNFEEETFHYEPF